MTKGAILSKCKFAKKLSLQTLRTFSSEWCDQHIACRMEESLYGNQKVYLMRSSTIKHIRYCINDCPYGKKIGLKKLVKSDIGWWM